MNKKKLVRIILLAVLLVLLTIIIIVGIRFKNTAGVIFNWDNIVSFVNSRKYNSGDIEKKMEANKNKMEKIAEENPHINIRGDLSPEEKAAFSEGKISREDAVSIIKGDVTLDDVLSSGKDNQPEMSQSQTGAYSTENNPSTEDKVSKQPENIPEPNSRPEDSPPSEQKNSQGKPTDDNKPQKEQDKANGTTKPEDDKSSDNRENPQDSTNQVQPEAKPPEKQDRVSEIIAELYLIQTEFLAQLEGIGDLAYAEYKSIHYDRSQVPAIVDSYMGAASALEAECDNKVNTLLAELKTELEKVGGDTSTVKEIRNFYYNEKSLKKTYYLNKMYDEDYK